MLVPTIACSPRALECQVTMGRDVGEGGGAGGGVTPTHFQQVLLA